MSRRFHTYSVMTVVLLAVGGFASAFLVQGGVAASRGQHQASAQASAATRARFARTLVGYLKGRGFQVNSGYPMLLAKDPEAICRNYTYPALNSCLGLNPAAPYVVTVVKSWPNEYVNPATVNMFGPVRPGYSPAYRLDPREAIVIYGQMPPPGRYMGLQTWEWSQRGHWKAKDYYKWAHNPRQPFPMSLLFSTMPPTDPKSGRVFSWSTLGDIINNVVMQRQSGYPFGKNRYFIITPSATTDHAVRRALQAQGVPGRYIFTEQIPSRDKFGPIGPLGMGKNAIDFNTWFRFAVPASQDAADAWRSQLPLTVLRVRAPASVGPVKRYGALIFDKHTAHSESYLAGDLQNLVKAVCDRTGSILGQKSADCTQPPPASSVMVDIVRELDDGDWRGPYCRAINMNCDGDNPDSAFFYSSPRPLDSGQVYAVVGTLATQTGNATYVGLSVNDAATLFTPANLLDTMLKGSANGYATTVKNAGKFFVHYYTRNCGVLEPMLGKDRLPLDCTPITDQMVPPQRDITALGDPALHGMFQVGIRDYIVPGTERGADTSKLLRPRILTFHPLAGFQGGGPH